MECLKNKTLTCVTDGSYMKDKAANICSAGWVMACKQTKRHISGTLVEHSESADSYRGECLGMLAIRLFLLAVEEYYGVITDGNKVCCDNKGALYTFAKKSKRVSSGAKNADIKRVIRTIEQRTQSSVVQHHVKGHQDEYIKRGKLTWEASWNCHCDKMAKKAINNYLRRVRNGAVEPLDNKSCRMLPLETARLYVNGTKQTSDVGKGLRRDIGRQTAREFYKEKGLLPTEVFDPVEWDRIELALSDKPRMYKLWYGKQCTGFCGTNSKLVQWGRTDNLRCLDCNRLNEDAAHLMECPSSHRRALLEEQICKLETWMASHSTEPALARLVAEYLRGGRQRTFARMYVPRELKELDRTQDRIGSYRGQNIEILLRNTQEVFESLWSFAYCQIVAGSIC